MDASSKVQDVVPFEGRFPSWEAFDVARKAHCEKTHTLYVCRNTVKVAIANKRRKLQVPDSWVYDRKVSQRHACWRRRPRICFMTSYGCCYTCEWPRRLMCMCA